MSDGPGMTRLEFLDQFDQQVSAAVTAAESRLGKALPQRRIIRFHGAGLSGKAVSMSEAAALLWLGDNLFSASSTLPSQRMTKLRSSFS